MVSGASMAGVPSRSVQLQSCLVAPTRAARPNYGSISSPDRDPLSGL